MDTVLIFLTFVLILIVILSITSFVKYVGGNNRRRQKDIEKELDDSETTENERESQRKSFEAELDENERPASNKISVLNEQKDITNEICKTTKTINTKIGELCIKSQKLDKYNDGDEIQTNKKHKYLKQLYKIDEMLN